jgi:hypothetical protein
MFANFSPPLLTASFLSVINQNKRLLFKECCEKGKPVVRRGRKATGLQKEAAGLSNRRERRVKTTKAGSYLRQVDNCR